MTKQERVAALLHEWLGDNDTEEELAAKIDALYADRLSERLRTLAERTGHGVNLNVHIDGGAIVIAWAGSDHLITAGDTADAALDEIEQKLETP